tara:strand:- start:354 stop:704 length:351 start_codon:yes stop_codon:yes gene_type:complete
MLKAKIAFNKAVAALSFGYYYIFKFFSDSASVSDQPSLDVSKPLADSWAVSEQKSFLVGKPLADSATIAEQSALIVTKPVSDILTTTDTGLLLMQDYVEVTGSYFLEDYVGTGQII